MNIKNYEDATDRLQDRLVDFLIEKGIIESKEQKFCCLSPLHTDTNPSMSVAPSGRVAHCFSCGFSINIFQAYSLIDNKPFSGPEWIHDNLKFLADKYSIEVELEQMTEEDLYELETRRAYRAASELIVNEKPTSLFSQAIADRGWTPEFCKEFGIGCVSNFNKFSNQLDRLGFSDSFRKEIDLDRPDIFGTNRLIFTIRDERGNPVGFSSRNLGYTDNKQNGSKYINQRTTGVKVNIYQKSKRLYGLDRALRTASRKKILYVFEGYADVITAAMHGLNNCVALGGIHMTPEQLQLMKEHNFHNIILCLDGDKTGRERVAWNLDNILAGHRDLKVRIIVIPEEKDPDQFIRESTISKFKSLTKWDAFEWRLRQFNDENDSEEICKSMIPLIMNETSFVTQDKMCIQLAKNTEVPLSVIRSELNRLQDRKEAQKCRERDDIIDGMIKECKRNRSTAEQSIRTAEDKLFEVARRFDEDSFSEETCLSVIDGLKEEEEAKDGSFSGFRLGPDLKTLEKALCGQWKRDVWFCIGGRPNCGKTSFVSKLIHSIASIEENDACVIYHTIDDTIQQVLPKFVCIADNSKRIDLNQVMDPNFHKQQMDKQQAEFMSSRRENGYEKIKQLIKTGRLVIKDANDGVTLAYADRLVRYYRRKFPNRNIVYVLDNFHKLQDSSGKDERTRFKALSNGIKNLATKYHICVISTAEYRKTQGTQRAGNQDLAETGQIEYDGNIVAHVHNDLHERKGQATYVHRDIIDGEEKTLPRIEFEIAKNKITAFKESIWLDFWPGSSDFSYVSNARAAEDARKEKQQTEVDTSDQHSLYRKVVSDVKSRGQSIGRAYHICKDEFGFEPPWDWRKEFENQQ